MIRSIVLTITLFGLCTSGNSVAQTASAGGGLQFSTASEYLGATSLVLSANRLSQPVSRSPAAVTIIDRDLIQAMDYKDLSDLFRHVPGMSSAHSKGNKHNVGYHGLRDLESRRMQVLIDGRSVYTPQFTGVEWEDIPLSIDDIERIEVIRSPSAATYGSNAFSSVINIITMDPSELYGSHVNLRGGSNGIAEGSLRHALHLNNLDVRITAGIRHENTLFERNFEFADGKTVPYLNIRSKARLTPSDILDVQLGYVGGTRDFGDPASPTEPPTKDAIRASFIQATYRRLLGPDEEIKLHAYRNSRTWQRDYLTAPLPLPGFPPPGLRYPVLFDVREERTEVEVQHSLPLGRNIRAAWGGAVRRDENRAPQIYQTDETQTNTVYRLFGSAEWTVSPSVVLHGSLMIEDNELGGTEVMPRIAANWQASELHAFRTSLSRGTRAPTFREESSVTRYYYQGILLDIQDDATGGLVSESLNAFEIGYMGMSRDRRWAWDAKVFYEQVDDIVAEIERPHPDDTQFDPDVLDWVNQDDATITGAEVQVDYRDKKNLLRFTHTELDIDGSDLSIRSLVSSSAPPRSTSLFYMRQLPNDWYVGIGIMRVGKSIPLGSNLTSPSHTRTDLRFGRKFRKGSVRGNVGVTIENATNTDIQEHKGLQYFDRRGYMTLRLYW